MVDAAGDSLELASELRPVLLRLARHLRSEAKEPVTGGQVALLVAIEFHPGITGHELAERENLSTAGVSGHLAKLEGANLIRRIRSSDRRGVGIHLTALGHGVLKSVRDQRTSWLAGRLAQLPPEEREIIRAAIRPLDNLTTGPR